jgi:hypothetical protein
LADRTGHVRRLTDIVGCPNQFGVRIAEIEARKPTSPELGEKMTAGEAVIDLSRSRSPYGLRTKRHWG